jgi:2-C-methyl-D-erythritol 2,4-cyclodiphosphate synthase
MMRIGHGYDVHRLVADRKLIIGGVEIPYALGLLGHSDADVLLHAICDAILGALSLGDIGQHFPDNDPAFEGIESVLLLERVIALSQKRGFLIGNLDCTVIAQRPKLSPHIPEMISTLANICRVPESCINIKATTTEQLGFVGREEGIAAHAVVLLATNDQKSDQED